MTNQPDKQRRTDDVLRFFVDRFSGEIGRVVLVKLAYLADLEGWRHLGRAVSGLSYKVDNHGPFDAEFYRSVERLEGRGLIAQAAMPTSAGVCYRFTSKQAQPYGFTGAERAVLDYIATTFAGKCSMSDLLDVAYSTEPFKIAKKAGKGAEIHLRDCKFEGSKEIGNLRLENILQGFEAIERGECVDVDDWMRELQGRTGPACS